jgi:hypothetical protein
MSDEPSRPNADWVEVTGSDLWAAIWDGTNLSFFICLVAAVVIGCTTTAIAHHGPLNGLILFAGCVLFGAFVYLPLRLGVVATDRRSGFVPGLIRFVHGLVAFVGTASLFLLLLARVIIYLLALVLKTTG